MEGYIKGQYRKSIFTSDTWLYNRHIQSRGN